MVNGYKPATLAEALEIRAAHAVTPYGGGTDLMLHADKNACYLFLDDIPELKQIRRDETHVRIGAACTFTQVLNHPLVPQFMQAAVRQIAAPAIRNLGTMGGNIGNGSAKADSVLIEFVTDAQLRLCSVRGERLVAIRDFYLGRKRLDLAADELIAEILLPAAGLDNWYYQKVGGRQALAISRVSFAGLLDVTEGRISRCACAFGAVADTVLRFPELEAMLVGLTLAEARAQKPAFLAAYDKAIVPTPGRVSAAFRKTACLNLLGDFLTQFQI